VILASGKVVYDLEAERTARKDTTTAILRVERLAPVPGAEIAEALAAYPEAEVVWVQDEPRNQGAWSYVSLAMPQVVGAPVRAVSRPASASTAAGSAKAHQAEQADLLRGAFER
jgi:multifunctional 2-oxoglutarate metabolism enzyme